MKTIILNGSPRKNWNTAMLLKEAEKGARYMRLLNVCIFAHYLMMITLITSKGK
ncbi:MAG: hypothetical protein J6O61_06905 [Butyrivibrio sp.]|uniref:hypothetical protein n=1 Tax=Butyrivibrio sp. TaxID=28121 RepID=UPI001B082C4A|nr:hypothetical protein [Butyrivibrio sp.]MBO6240546.1 hypothetical protein [Butyrivibrio sp.]